MKWRVTRRRVREILTVCAVGGMTLGAIPFAFPVPNLRLLTSAGLGHAIIRVSDLPKPAQPVAGPAVSYKVFSHFASVLPVSSQSGAFACYPPSALSKLHMTQALAETVANGDAGAALASWQYCAYTFASTTNAHKAFLALAKPLKVSVKQGTGSTLKTQTKIGSELAGLVYAPDPIEAQDQIVVRSGRSVGYIVYLANGYPYTVKQFLHLAAVASSRLPR
jgi:hypothetical protein